MIYQYDLSGSWAFRLDNEMKGMDAHFERQTLEDSMLLPGTTATAKKGIPNEEINVGYLTEEYKTEGFAWFQKRLSIAPEAVGEHAVLYLERTRISHVWVDGMYVGTQNSLCTAHVYDLTDYIKTSDPVITIMTANTGYPTKGGHMTSPDTQTNWNGIVGKMTLSFYHTLHMTHIRTDVDYDTRRLTARIRVMNYGAACEVHLCAKAAAVTLDNYDKQAEPITLINSQPATLSHGEQILTLETVLPSSLPDWDEYDPAVIRLSVGLTKADETAEQDSVSTWFGIRKFEARGTHFYINNRKTFLRGKHDGMIFPLTGYAPMDVDGWLTVMKAAKEFGINHYRCHTCCPPDAAFLAADLLGIYYEPELPFWGTFAAEGEKEYDAVNQNYLIEEGFRILDEFGNHPSFCMMSMGNELWGNPGAINELLGRYKAHDARVLYTQGSNNFQWVPNIQPNDDFFCGVRFTIDRQIRGSYAMCDAPQGHVQTDRPCTDFNYEDAIFPPYNAKAAEVSEDGTIEIQYGTGVKRVKLTEAAAELIPNVPVVSHEIGQYETYPDFDEINKYTGVLKARNFETFKKRLEEKGLLPLAKDYFKNSGALAAACYKDELETALRTKDMAGFQILDIQDFSGQGTALVGMLDAFMENKGILSAKEWRSFCSDAVLQAEFPGYVLQNGASFHADLSLTWYRKELPADVTIHICLTEGTDRIFEGSMPFANALTENGYTRLGSFEIALPADQAPHCYRLTVSMEGTDIANTYELWSYPDYPAVPILPEEYADYVTADFVQAVKRTQAGAPVVLCLNKDQNPNSITGTYATDFWCYPMFRSISESMGKPIPVGTMGLLIREDHPAMAAFPTHTYSTPQWWDIVMNSASTILDDTVIEPIVQTIDNFERNHRLGLIYELQIAGAKAPIILCTSPLPDLITEGHKEASCLLQSLCSYAAHISEYPHDIVKMTEGEFFGLFAKTI